MAYWVHDTDMQITIHDGICRKETEKRHGPFKRKIAAVAVAQNLALSRVSSCGKCGGVGDDLDVECDCRECSDA